MSSNNNEIMHFSYEIDGENFASAGQASVAVKKSLGRIGIDPAIIKKVAIAMYEGEINMVIYANGGTADVFVHPDSIEIILHDDGPGIADVEKAMEEGFSTVPDNIRSLGFGAGMGLPNIKRYTDKLEIESTPGAGTKITMLVNY